MLLCACSEKYAFDSAAQEHCDGADLPMRKLTSLRHDVRANPRRRLLQREVQVVPAGVSTVAFTSYLEFNSNIPSAEANNTEALRERYRSAVAVSLSETRCQIVWLPVIWAMSPPTRPWWHLTLLLV